MGCEKRRGVKDDIEALGLKSWEDGVVNSDGEGVVSLWG